MPPKARGFLDFPIINGGSFSPIAEQVRTTVTLSLPCFPPLHDSATWFNVESGNARKKKPVSSILKTFLRSYTEISDVKDVFHWAAASRSTFPYSPQTVYDRTLFLCFHFCSHPSEAENWFTTPKQSAICFVFSWRIGPLIGYPRALAAENHLHKMILMSLCWTILALDSVRLLSASCSRDPRFCFAAWTVPLDKKTYQLFPGCCVHHQDIWRWQV